MRICAAGKHIGPTFENVCLGHMTLTFENMCQAPRASTFKMTAHSSAQTSTKIGTKVPILAAGHARAQQQEPELATRWEGHVCAMGRGNGARGCGDGGAWSRLPSVVTWSSPRLAEGDVAAMAGEGAMAGCEACFRPVAMGGTLGGGVSPVSAESEAKKAGKFARANCTERQRSRCDFLHSISNVSPCSSPAERQGLIAVQPSAVPAPLEPSSTPLGSPVSTGSTTSERDGGWGSPERDRGSVSPRRIPGVPRGVPGVSSVRSHLFRRIQDPKGGEGRGGFPRVGSQTLRESAPRRDQFHE
jgi:hypothetical protein